MIKYIFLALFSSIPAFASAMTASNDETIAMYQELCAKERDPLKRHNYCYLIENSGNSHAETNAFRVDRAVV